MTISLGSQQTPQMLFTNIRMKSLNTAGKDSATYLQFWRLTYLKTNILTVTTKELKFPAIYQLLLSWANRFIEEMESQT